MLAYLEGTIIAKTTSGAIIQSGSLGFEVVSQQLLNKSIGDQVTLYTVLHIGSDNQPILLGFDNLASRALYFQLVKVPGVGPKTAQKVIESATLSALQTAIIEGDYNFFTRVKGLGKKNAQKIILELKNILVEPATSRDNQALYSALRALNFTTAEIDRATRNLDLAGLDESAALKLVLQSLGRS